MSWRRAARCCGSGLALLIAVSLPGQTLVHEVDGKKVIEVEIMACVGSASSGGLGFVCVYAQNLDRERHGLRVAIEASHRWQANAKAERAFVLLPEERARFWLPVPSQVGSNLIARLTVDSSTHTNYLGSPWNAGKTALLLTGNPSLESAALGFVQALWARTPTGRNPLVLCDDRAVPSDWRLFTAFELVIVDGKGRIGGDEQEALRRFAHAGGRLCLLDADRLPAGPLRALFDRASGVETVPYGLGVVTVASSLPAAAGRLVSELGKRADALPVWPLPMGVQQRQQIPGLGQVPVSMFVIVILLFAIAVGPVNFFWLRKKRRPLLAIVTVPALGLGATLLMSVYAIMHDGFGVRGVVRSWSLLDQEQHEVATIATRTLFAGLSRGSIPLDGDTVLLAPGAFMDARDQTSGSWRYSAGDDELAGAVLPARTQTPLVTARQGVARQRLRAKQRADGNLDLLTDGGVMPIGEVLLRDFEGSYWRGVGSVLQPCREEDAAATLESLRRVLRVHERTVPIVDRYGNVTRGEAVSLDGLATGMLRLGDLRPGSYVAQIRQAPWLPEHGLEVDYERETHHVIGLLAAEDFVR